MALNVVGGAALGLAVAALILGLWALSNAPASLSAAELLRDASHEEQRRRRQRQQGSLARALLPPAPGFLVSRVDTAALETALAQAGSPYGFTAQELVRFRVLVAVLAALMAALLFSGSEPVLLAVLAAAALAGGYRLPDLWVASLASSRVTKLDRSLPDAVDSLVLALDAGMDLEGALRRLVPKMKGPLRDAFDDVLAELDTGFSLATALERLAARTRSNDLADLVALVLQSRRLGVSLSAGLRTQVGEMRARRRTRVQESAQQAPLKMMIPLVLFFLPALMIVFLAPAILSFVAGGG